MKQIIMREKSKVELVESIELMGDKEFMNSYVKAKEQIKKKEFEDWNAL